MKKQDYYIGLDIGTNSVGWAVTDEKYNVLKFRKKSMWGVRLFEEGSTAEERRGFRSSRRRIKRTRNRVLLLQEFFAEEIGKVDGEFFLRLNESKFYPEDKIIQGHNTLFNDKNYIDKDFHKEYPTFYHLRIDLIQDKSKKDIRLIYLALQHIMKLRGHFLFPGDSMDSVDSFDKIFSLLQEHLREEYDEELECKDISKVEDILKSKDKNIMDKTKEVKGLCSNLSPHQKTIIDLICGKSVNIDKITNEEDFKENEVKKIDFKSASYEDNIDTIKSEIGEKYYLIELIKAIYDWSVLEEILSGEKYLSIAKVNIYEEHKKDLEILKRVIRKYCSEKYSEVFRSSNDKLENYPSYIGKNSKNGKKQVIEKHCSQEDFYKYIRKTIKDIEAEDSDIEYINRKISSSNFLELQRNNSNSTVPNQINKGELKRILENASKHYEFLNEKDENGFSVKDKIIKIFEFRIPYYVGPLNGHSDKFSWIIKKTDEKIYPWNFKEVVNIEESGERFIKRMTNKCSYLIGEDVLPKESILYSKFAVLNEINNIKINGEPIEVSLKQDIFNDLCLKEKKLSLSKIKKYLINKGIMAKSDEVTGVDINLGSNMKSYIEIENIIGEKISLKEMVENIILWISLFTTEEKIIYEKIKAEYIEILTEEECRKLSRLKFTGWGRLSKTLLNEIYILDNETGEMISIIKSLWETNYNFMELLSYKNKYIDEIEKYNDENFGNEKIDYDSLDEFGISPAIKRSLWQTVLIVKEITKIRGAEPKKIFIEVAREHGEKNRTSSRKKQLEELYKNTKVEEKNLLEKISKLEERDFRINRLFLYYLQNGKCVYTEEQIELDQLYNKTMYDIDHIYPRSVTKDNSLDNLVLVTRKSNEIKTDNYPINEDIQRSRNDFWKKLRINNFISEEKFYRLTRKTELTAEEKSKFIARQLVETRQSSKAAAEIFKRMYEKSEIVYVKAGNVSDFRNGKVLKLIKVREINDLHHAKDAYLNIVVGNVYHTKFTSNPINYVKASKKREYNLEKLFEYKVERNGKIAWDPKISIKVVKKQMSKNNISVTKKPIERRGGFFDQQLMKKGSGQYPIKTKDERLLNIDKYGGYNKVSNAYFALVEHEVKGEKVRTIEKVPIIIAQDLKDGKIRLEEYYRDNIGLKNIKIINPRILINSLFQIDGFKLNITGSSGDSYLFANAIQFIVEENHEDYIKKIVNVNNKIQDSKGKYTIDEYDKITGEKNLEIYDVFSDKLNNSIYKNVFGKFGELLITERECFEKMDLEKQIYTLLEILKLFTTDRRTSDLKNIKGAGTAGVLKKAKKIDKYEEAYLINQSITGMFEKKVNILKDELENSSYSK